jgi:hypothetical protein
MAYPRSRAIKVSAVRKSQEFEQVSNIEKIADRLKARLKSK